MDFGFPPFTRVVKMLVYANTAIFVVLFLLGMSNGQLVGRLVDWFGLVPVAVVHGYVWQVVTYSFLHASVMHLLFNMLSLWMFGSRLEVDWGRQRFLGFFFFCVIGAALCTVAISFTGVLGMSPRAATVGASGGIYGLIVAFGILYAEMRVYIYGIFAIKAKYFAMIWVALALFGALGSRGDINNVAHLGGALFGYIYIRLLPRRGARYLFSESYYGMLNRYHLWRRKQLQKKFKVYMREHDRDRHFDDEGSLRGPGPQDKSDGEEKGGRGGWVN